MWWIVLIVVVVAFVGSRLIRAATMSPEKFVELQEQRALRDAKSKADRKQRALKARASENGVIYRGEYMDAEAESMAFTLDSDGMPNGHLERERDRLVIVTDHGMVNPRSVHSYKLGIYSFTIRGTSHYEKPVTRDGRPTTRSVAEVADLRPGKSVRLVRDPDNSYDVNAVAVRTANGRDIIGYVNKLNAARIAKLLDAGVELTAISTRGNGAGSEESTPQVLAARPAVMTHLMRNL